jgi:putative oxidoreductase
MTAYRRIGQGLLASIFIYGGIDQIRNPKPKIPSAEPVGPPIADAIPADLPKDTELLVKVNGAVQVAGGTLLVLGRFPRLAAAALAGSLVPTTAAGHRFWEAEDDGDRRQQMIHFLKNLSILGGLVIATADTGGRPTVTWTAKKAAGKVKEKANR